MSTVNPAGLLRIGEAIPLTDEQLEILREHMAAQTASADEALRRRVKKIRKSAFSLEKAKNLVLETPDPEHAVECWSRCLVRLKRAF